MVRTIVPVIIGYAAIAILVLATDVLLGGVFHAGRSVFTVVNLAMALPYGLAGGYITARMSQANPMAAAIALCVLAVIMSAFTLYLDRGRQPLWYSCALPALVVVGALAGAHLRKRQFAAAP